MFVNTLRNNIYNAENELGMMSYHAYHVRSRHVLVAP